MLVFAARTRKRKEKGHDSYSPTRATAVKIFLIARENSNPTLCNHIFIRNSDNVAVLRGHEYCRRFATL